MAGENNRLTGSKFEGFACGFLKRRGHKILRRNFRRPYGEIDIISRRGKEIWFVEVKARKIGGKYPGYEAVGQRKISRLRKVALPYSKKYPGFSFRIGIVSIEYFPGGEIYEFIQNAFEF